MTDDLAPFGAEFWEERYRSQPAIWSGRPNPQLVAEAEGLTPGSALDAGSGEGADAIWLSGRGWQVTAVDISAVALERAAAQAGTLGADVAGRIRWTRADLTGWTPDEAAYDLVSAQFMHLPPEPRSRLFARLAAAVAPGGVLLIVGHHPSDLETSVRRPPMPELFYTAEEIAAELDPQRWEIEVAAARPRPAKDAEEREVTVHDSVLRARRLK
ncbi:class I SAM-dependent methyltransferase [Nonomuraea sp. NN258]|uniref:SAM-dependent methyltransferase n=1 Tax=Nonomuraea antri TaxID=2730852 RepID=UPI001568F9A0|nr:class I SAM-dependent methyltransferase [Nonomuraea antri]NRQ35490.1 class I SAM-dependent methyltransferase [Nonomuraea antri]